MAKIKDVIFNKFDTGNRHALVSVSFKPILAELSGSRGLKFKPILQDKFSNIKFKPTLEVVKNTTTFIPELVVFNTDLVLKPMLQTYKEYVKFKPILEIKDIAECDVYFNVYEYTPTTCDVYFNVYKAETCDEKFIELNC